MPARAGAFTRLRDPFRVYNGQHCNFFHNVVYCLTIGHDQVGGEVLPFFELHVCLVNSVINIPDNVTVSQQDG